MHVQHAVKTWPQLRNNFSVAIDEEGMSGQPTNDCGLFYIQKQFLTTFQNNILQSPLKNMRFLPTTSLKFSSCTLAQKIVVQHLEWSSHQKWDRAAIQKHFDLFD